MSNDSPRLHPDVLICTVSFTALDIPGHWGQGILSTCDSNFLLHHALSRTKHLTDIEIPYQTSSAGNGKLTWLYIMMVGNVAAI